MSATPAGYHRGYLPLGKVAHLLSDQPPGNCVAACGLWADFWGTGSQEEYERAEALRLCRLCTAAVARPYRP